MWDIKLKATNEHKIKETNTHRHRQEYGGDQREGGWGTVKGKGGQIYGDGRRFDFGWWAHSVIHRSCIIEPYPRDLYDLTNQCHPSQFNLKKLNMEILKAQPYKLWICMWLLTKYN